MIFKYEQIYLNFIRMHFSIMHAHMYTIIVNMHFDMYFNGCELFLHSLTHSWNAIAVDTIDIVCIHAFQSSIYKINSNKICVKSNDVVPWVSVYIKKDVCGVTLFDDASYIGNIYGKYKWERNREWKANAGVHDIQL